MFLDRSWPFRGGASDIYMPYKNHHMTNRNRKFHINEVFYSCRKKGPLIIPVLSGIALTNQMRFPPQITPNVFWCTYE